MTIEHITPADGNIFADLGFPPEEAANLKIRSDLMLTILQIMADNQLKQAQAAKLFGVTRPRISDVKRGKIDELTTDSLVDMLTHAGIRVDFPLNEAM
jgi:predicted XRE-type DNA-binding protein